MRTRYLLIPLALAHLLLALLYASQTPYRQPGYVNGSPSRGYTNGQLVKDYGAPDERQHANYVQRLLAGQGLPVFNPKDPNLYENYQGHQPPLFYFMDAQWCRVAGVENLIQPDGVKARYLNALLDALTVCGVFFVGLWGLGRKDVGLVAAGIVALIPMMAALDGAISNDPLLFCLCTWCLAFTARQAREGWTWAGAGAVGVLAGLAILTKTTGVALLPIVFLAGFLRTPEGIKPKFATVLTALGIALLIAAPWWARNQANYGDPLAIKAFNEAFVGSPKTADLIEGMGAATYWREMFGYWTMRSFFGVFGYMDIFLNETGTSYMGPKDPNALYMLLFVGSVLLSLGGVRWATAKDASGEKNGHILNVAFFALVFLLYLRFNLQYFQAQARYLYPAVAPVGIAIASGVCAIAKNRWQIGLAAVAGVLLYVNYSALTRLPREFALRGTDEAAKAKYLQSTE